MLKFDHEMDRPQEVPHDEYQQLMDEVLLLRQTSIGKAVELNRTLRALRDGYLNDLHKLIGEDKLKRYLLLHERRMKEMADARLRLPLTADGINQLNDHRKEIVARSIKLIQDAGVDTNRVIELQETYKQRALEEIEKLDRDDLMECISEDDPSSSPNKTYKPPYIGTRKWVYSTHSNGAASPVYGHSLWAGNGRLASHSTISVKDADDSDYAGVWYKTDVGFLYRMPAAGKLRIKVEFDQNEYLATGDAVDECGISSFDLRQYIYCYVELMGIGYAAGLSTKRYMPYEKVESTSGPGLGPGCKDKWSTQGYGGIRTLHFGTLPPAFNKGDFVLIFIGVYAKNYFWVNDVSVSMSLKIDLLASQVHVSVM